MGFFHLFRKNKKAAQEGESSSQAKRGGRNTEPEEILKGIKEILREEGPKAAMNGAFALMMDKRYTTAIKAWQLIARNYPEERERCEALIKKCTEEMGRD